MNVQIPVKWLQELLALCGPEDHELRERVMASITAMNEQDAGPVVMPEADAAVKEVMELVGTAMDSAMKAGELLLDSHEKFNAQFASAKSLKKSIESKLRAVLVNVHAPQAQADARDAEIERAVLAERERICAAIKAEDDHCVTQGDYMLDSDDCIKVARGEWVRPVYDAAIAAAKGE